MKTRFTTLSGHPFFVREWGDPANPTMLCLHGFPEYGGAWSDIAAHLSDRFHIVAPDQRGYGQSWAPPDIRDYATPKLVADMAELIGDDGPVLVFGHDWGAAVAYGLAMWRSDLVSKLIIANGVHPVPFQRALARGGAQAKASQYINKLREEGSEAFFSANNYEKLSRMFAAHMNLGWLSGERAEAYRHEWARPGRLRGMINWYRASPLVVADPGAPVDMPDLPLDKLRVPMPHLLIWGAADTALLPEATEGLEEFAPDLTRRTLPDADHWLLHTHAADVAAIVRDWV